MKVLCACEESQAVCKAFRANGHEAYSCDILPCSGGEPEWHIQGDVLPLLEQDWDMIIAFPPCTYLSAAGSRWFNVSRYGDSARQRHKDRQAALEFFMQFANCRCGKVAIENPIGFASTAYRRPDQIVQPYQFGHDTRKATCLWLKGLPALVPTEIVEPKVIRFDNGKTDTDWHFKTLRMSPARRKKERSKTFTGIAGAMADQWGGEI